MAPLQLVCPCGKIPQRSSAHLTQRFKAPAQTTANLFAANQPHHAFRKAALISDIDNTLIGDKPSLQTLGNWLAQQRGKLVFGVATGRPLESAVSILKLSSGENAGCDYQLGGD